ncbi:MAG: ABC transporter ATP-binding protein, partial [Bacilli bacterium]|nr:ABC transporter ATP-binding protein [Bacilli bacterium]
MLVSRWIFRFSLQSAAHRITKGIRKDMYDKAVELPISYFHENPVGNVMSWFTNDVFQIEDFLSWGTVMEIDAIFMSTFAIFRLFNCSWQLALIAIIPISLIVIWGALVETRMSKMWDYRQQVYDELYDYSRESFAGIRVIKAFVKENQQLRSFSKVAKKNKDMNVRFVRTDTIFNCVINIIINSISAIVIGFGGWFVISCIQGSPVYLFGAYVDITAAKLVEFTGYFDILIWPMIAMGQVVAMYSRSRTSLKRIQHFLNAPVDIKNPDNPIVLENVKGQIEFNDFTFFYPGNKKPSLSNISLTINPGETIGIVGKIGCGKTTLVNALLHIYNVDKNTIKIDGVDVMDCDLTSLRNTIAYVPQDNFLYSDKVRNNIAFSKANASFEDIEAAAKFACVSEDIEGFSEKYDTISGERGVTLSGGQKQRISIARAFLKDAPILVMDDSVSAVDTKTEEVILKN